MDRLESLFKHYFPDLTLPNRQQFQLWSRMASYVAFRSACARTARKRKNSGAEGVVMQIEDVRRYLTSVLKHCRDGSVSFSGGPVRLEGGIQ